MTPALPHADTSSAPETVIADLRTQLRDAELAIIKANCELTRLRAAGASTEQLENDLFDFIEARDFMRARLTRLEGEAYG